jgi:hypothetical protein
MAEIRNAYNIFVGNLRVRDHLEDVGVDGKVILEWILGNRVEGCRLDLARSG